MKNLTPWLIISLAAAASAFVSACIGLGFFGFGPERSAEFSIALSRICFGFTFLWLMIVAVAAIRLRWQALWLVVASAPFAMFPLVFIMLFSTGIERCEIHLSPIGCVS
jgi:hypothetical protein